MSEVGTDIVQKAKSDGWVPQEEWKGNPDEWVPADQFVERGEKINNLLQAKNRRLEKQMQEEARKHQAELEELRKDASEFRKFVEEASQRKVSELEVKLRELRAARSEATSQEDHERAAQIEEQIDDLKEEKQAVQEQLKENKKKAAEPKQEPKPTPELDPEVQAWMSENQWYGNVEEYLEETEIVTALAKSLRVRNPNLVGNAFFKALDERISRSEDLERIRPSKKKGPTVEGGEASRRGNTRKTGRTYDDLPPDAKAACDRYVKQYKGYTVEKYLADYDWEDQ